MAENLLELAKKLNQAQGGMSLQFLPSERALLMQALSSLAPLLDLSLEREVSPREMPEPERCARSLQELIARSGEIAA
jgi:hypothetical protein